MRRINDYQQHFQLIATYSLFSRYFGHSLSDPGTTYRSREEITNIRNNHDPIKLLARKIMSLGLGTESELDEIERDSKQVIEKAVTDAMTDLEPSLQDLVTDIYAVYKENVRGVLPKSLL